jgi:hypothetical protein
MGVRGVKRKPVALKVLEGSKVTRKTDKSALRRDLPKKQIARMTAEERAFGPPEMPAHFKGEAARTWKRYVVPAPWLTKAREPAAIAFCELWEEYREDPRSFSAARHNVMRRYMNELGFTDERYRYDPSEDEEEEFFG